jgi:spore coat polysaccharide biosynthesis predicted glycosyltransferase SpsG
MKTANLPPDASLIIIMGNNSPALPRVRKLAAELPWSAEVAVNVNDMPSLMAEADLAIGAAGTTTWERCCLGLPTIITETAANQAGIARNMIAAGAALYPGSLLADDFPHRLRRVLEQAMLPDCLAALSAHSARICDGGGTERVVAVMNAGTAP